MLSHLLAAAALALAPTPSSFATHGIDAFASARSASPRANLDRPWCGAERTTDDTADQVHNGAFRYHAILAVPAGAPSRLSELAPQMQADALDASKLLELRYGRAIRLDLGTRCGPHYLDISVLHMRQSAAELQAAAQRPDGTLQAIYDELAAAGWPVTMPAADSAPLRHTNYVVWLDGPAPEDACGQATLYADPRRSADNRNNMGGSVAALFRDGDGFCDGDAVRHEIGHTLGAVVPGAAPHADPTGHCTDAYEDTMCLDSSPKRASGSFQGQFFDYGNDDYWDPPGGHPLAWWTVDLNRFLCKKAGCNGVTATGPAPAAAPLRRASAARSHRPRRAHTARRSHRRSRRRSAARRARRFALRG